MKSRSIIRSFQNSLEGLVHVLHADWHVGMLFLIGAVMLLISAIAKKTREELMLLCLAIALVVLAELFNSAIEAVVDLASPDIHPLAKAAKDVGSAGVLIACAIGLLVAAGVFINAKTLEALRGAGGPPPHVAHVALVGAITVLVAVVLAKLWGGSPSLTRGGWVSAHSALAFFCFVSVWFLTPDFIIRFLSFALAVLVAQSRVEAGIHRTREVFIGGVVALVVGSVLYSMLSMRAGM